MLAGSYDKTLTLWDVASGKKVKTLKGHANCIDAVCFSPDGKRILSAGTSGKDVILWDAETGNKIRSFVGHKGNVKALAFSEGRKVARKGIQVATYSGLFAF